MTAPERGAALDNRGPGLRIAESSAPGGSYPTPERRRGAASLIPLRERDLARLWEAGTIPPAAIVAQDGTPLQVVYRGRLNSGAGPDFRDAVIALPDAGLLHGDVELHLLASNFRRHGHDRDPAYARVILHLVYRADDGATTALPGGRRARVVALEPWLAQRASQIGAMLQQPALWREPCQSAVDRLSADAVLATLARLGERRLREKSLPLAHRPAAAALYEGLLRTLGHGPHVGAWLELARRVPVERLEAVALAPASGGPDAAARTLEALFLTATGLLPPVESGGVAAGAISGKEAGKTGRGEVKYLPLPALGPSALGGPQATEGRGEGPTREDTSASGGSPTEDQVNTHAYLLESWQIWRAWGAPAAFPIPATGPRRPANHPARRLAGLARLLSGGPEALLHRLRASLLAERAPAQALLGALSVEAEGAWSTQALPWTPASPPPGALIGRSKAVELALNAVLPLLLAEAERERRPLLESAVLRAFHDLPAAGGYGRTAHLARALRADGGALLRGSDRTQGALHLWAHYCTQGGCGRCPLS